jgi:serine/threonine protein kinase
MASQDAFEAEYTVCEVVGRGTYSVVHRAVHRQSGIAYAAKFISQSVSGFNPDEATILSTLCHRHVVRVHAVYRTEQQTIIVMPLLHGGELFSVAAHGEGLGEEAAAKHLHQLLSAVKYVHDEGVVHRDIKLENILLNHCDDDIVLTDFGFSKRIGTQRCLNSCCGSPNYMSPEMLRAPRTQSGSLSLPSKHGSYGREVDLWSVGVVMYVLLVGQYPFYHERRSQWHKQILEGSYVVPPASRVSAMALDLLRSLLDVNIATRATAASALDHPWFASAQPAAAAEADPIPTATRSSPLPAAPFSTPKKGPSAHAAATAAAAAAALFTPPHNTHVYEATCESP